MNNTSLDRIALNSLREAFEYNAEKFPDSVCFTWLDEKGEEETKYTNLELLNQIKRTAEYIRTHTRIRRGESVLLCYPPSPDFAVVFWACIFSGYVAVPIIPPFPGSRLPHDLARMKKFEASSQAAYIFTNSYYNKARVAMRITNPLSAGKWPKAKWSTIDLKSISRNIHAVDFQEPEPPIQPNDLAYLQYTSGSTADPKGVMVSYDNLWANVTALKHQFMWKADISKFSDFEEILVHWLPHWHDMGLIGGLCALVGTGLHMVLFSPLIFMRNPVMWMKAISKYKAGYTCAPNFAYSFLCNRITDAELGELDLSGLHSVFCGSEPVRYSTMKQFVEKFACVGIDSSCLMPGYGLAECTLMVTSRPPTPRIPITVLRVDMKQLEQKRQVRILGSGSIDGVDCTLKNEDNVRYLVGCGTQNCHTTVIIASETREVLPECSVGEILVAGRCKTLGYYNLEDATKKTFRVRVHGGGPEIDCLEFLSTGDTGFLYENELFITGRQKDIIIVNGRNIAPQDIEETVENCNKLVRFSAAFATVVEEEEKACVVVELRDSSIDRKQKAELVESIRLDVSKDHMVLVHAVILLKKGMIPKTTSGKIMRAKVRSQYSSAELPGILYKSVLGSGVDELVPEGEGVFPAINVQPSSSSDDGSRVSESEFRKFLKSYLSQSIGVSAVSNTTPFAELGVSSSLVVKMLNTVETEYGLVLSPALAFDYPCIKALSEHVVKNWKSYLKNTGIEPKLNCVDSLGKIEVASTVGNMEASLPISVVGIGCRFPSAPDASTDVFGPHEFWKFLLNSSDAVCAHKIGSRYPGSYLKEIEAFDYEYFGIGKNEASSMDPQQGIVLEVAQEARNDVCKLEQASNIHEANIGVFVGASAVGSYNIRHSPEVVQSYIPIGGSSSIIANRVSYCMNLRGPSIVIDSACSSSLVAVHSGILALRSFACDFALAGGVNLLLDPSMSRLLARAGFLSPTGRCHTFDDRADGYVRGEGCGLVMLMPSHRATADNYRIYCDVIGGYVNQDGRSNGLVAPNGLAQESCIKRAYESAGVQPNVVEYVEAHGTGTQLGDLIEVSALNRVFCGSRKTSLKVGSVKTNLGHLELAAGIAGFIKVCLSLYHHYIPATIEVKKYNTKIPFEAMKIHVQTKGSEWDGKSDLYSGVSSFGFGGTNCHIAMKSAGGNLLKPDTTQNSVMKQNDYTCIDKELCLLPISARTRDGFKLLKAKYLGLLNDIIESNATEEQKQQLSQSLCSTASLHATVGSFKCAFTGSSATILHDAIREHHDEHAQPSCDCIFSFPDYTLKTNIAWWRELYFTIPLFRNVFDQISVVAGPLVSHGLTYYANYAPIDESIPPEISYLISFGCQVALARVWLRVCSKSPKLLVGNGMGEIAASVVSGALSIKQGIILVSSRAKVLARYCGVEDRFDEVAADFIKEIGTVYYNTPKLPILSSVSQKISNEMEPIAFDATYWGQQLIQKSSVGLDASDNVCIQMLPEVPLCETIGMVYNDGIDVNWKFLRSQESSFCDLPIYAWDHSSRLWNREWFDSDNAPSPSSSLSENVNSRKAFPPLCLSADSEASLRSSALSFASYLEANDIDMYDFAAAAAASNPFLPHRLALTLGNQTDTLSNLRTFASGQSSSNVKYGNAETRKNVVWLFSGQGNQYSGMGVGLYSTEKVFRTAIDECARLMKPNLAHSLLDILNYDESANPVSEINHTANAQPALFAFEYALAQLWLSWGVEPAAVMGHSVGELVAACIAGILCLEDACKLVATRGKLMGSLPNGGTMATVYASHSVVHSILKNRVSIAAINGPSHVVISGPIESVEECCSEFSKMGIKSKRLRVSHAFHSALMEPILDEFFNIAQTVTYNPPKFPLVLNVSGEFAVSDSICSEYLKIHISHPVQFYKSITTLAERGYDTYLEIGPNSTLLGMAVGCLDQDILAVPSIRRGQSSTEVLHEAMCSLFASGCLGLQSLQLFFTGSSRDSYPLLGTKVSSLGGVIVFEAEYSREFPSFLNDHKLGKEGNVVFPAAGFVSLVIHGLCASFGEGICTISDAQFWKPFVLTGSATLRLTFSPLEDSDFSFTIATRQHSSDWVENVTGRAIHEPKSSSPAKLFSEPTGGEFEIIPDFYDRMKKSGFNLGPTFQYIKKLHLNSSHKYAVAQLKHHGESDQRNYEVFPGLIDSVFQVIGLFLDIEDTDGSIYLPFKLDSFQYYKPFSCETTLSVQMQSNTAADYQLVDGNGDLVIEIKGLHVKRVPTAVFGDSFHSFHSLTWELAPLQQSQFDDVPGVFVIFALNQEAALSLQKLLEARGNTCIIVVPSNISWHNDDFVRIDPSDLDIFNSIWRKPVWDPSLPIRGIVHLLGTQSYKCEDDYVAMGTVCLMHIAQSMVRNSVIAPVFVVTRNCQNVQKGVSENDFDVGTMFSPMWGMARTLRLEHPELKFVCIDLDVTPMSDTEPQILENEILSNLHEFEVSYKMIDGDYNRSVARIRQYAPKQQNSIKFKSDLTYVITGGVGELALHISHWLVDNGVKYLALTSHSDPSSAAEEKLNHLRSLGAVVLFFKCDIGVRTEVESLLQSIEHKMPAISSVFHLAGRLLDGSLLQSSISTMEKVLRPKMFGALYLHELTNPNLDSFVLFSSVASLLGSPMQLNYSGANAYLDSLAEHRKARGQNALVINWGPWAKIGMASKVMDGNRFAANDLLDPDYCLKSLGILMNTDQFSAAVVSNHLLMKYAKSGSSILQSEFVGDAIPEALKQLDGLDKKGKMDYLKNIVANEVVKLIGSDFTKVETTAPLTELGMDSLSAMELRNRLSDVVGISFPTSMMLDYPTVEALAGYILENLFEDLPIVGNISDDSYNKVIEVADVQGDDVEIKRSFKASLVVFVVNSTMQWNWDEICDILGEECGLYLINAPLKWIPPDEIFQYIDRISSNLGHLFPFQPDRIVVVGYSSTAWIAHELGAILLDRGLNVMNVVQIDPLVGISPEASARQKQNFAKLSSFSEAIAVNSIAWNIGAPEQLLPFDADSKDLFALLQAWAKVNGIGAIENETVKRMANQYNYNSDWLKLFAPSKLNISTIVIRATQRDIMKNLHFTFEHCKDCSIAVIDVNATHWSIQKSKHIPFLLRGAFSPSLKPFFHTELIRAPSFETDMLFCCRGAGSPMASVTTAFGDIAGRLSKKLTVYEFGEYTEIRSIGETAKVKSEIINILQPHGSISLAGYSIGGVVAWEIAKQLIGMGRRIKLLAIIDWGERCRFPETTNFDSIALGIMLGTLLKSGLTQASLDWNMVNGLIDFETKVKYCFNWMRTTGALPRIFMDEVDANEVLRSMQMVRSRLETINSYTAMPFSKSNCPETIMAWENGLESEGIYKMNVGDFLSKIPDPAHFEVRELPTTHLAIMHGSFGAEIADHMKNLLRR